MYKNYFIGDPSPSHPFIPFSALNFSYDTRRDAGRQALSFCILAAKTKERRKKTSHAPISHPYGWLQKGLPASF